ncbi:cytochrome P450 [Oceanicola sp. 22II-s10i]|uniref:cytochrome P450 n=1 Tax=Oceanicola sp. 22II-s10i TaxID=1317116 RepID=UPI000B5221AE|nr:cytochrome P450 [Oceanicola sp. 22II-s10i]OWU84433.1 cytochrome P450 [Oceanicola sp. 22II-s10i]
MTDLTQSPTEPAFVQDPYPFYRAAREQGPIHHWTDYGIRCAFSHAAVSHCLRDRRFGREAPPECAPAIPDRLRPFYDIEAHSMLELEPPRHTRLRRLVLAAFTSRRIAEMGPEIAALARDLATALPRDGTAFDLIPAFANRLPIAVICRLLGVPEEMSDQLLRWSNDMVAMYQARRTPEIEAAACDAATAFSDFLRSYVEERRSRPADDLLTQLIAAEEDGEALSTDELISTCILLLNAGHEATVHTIGNGVKLLLDHGHGPEVLTPDTVDGTVEEILRHDPPLHMFTRWAYEDIDVMGHQFRRGDRVGLMLAAANRDPRVWEDPDRFDPTRPVRPNTSFGAGLHFCIGAPLARLELRIALPVLFEHHPGLRIAEPPAYADLYHFHGLDSLVLASG